MDLGLLMVGGGVSSVGAAAARPAPGLARPPSRRRRGVGHGGAGRDWAPTRASSARPTGRASSQRHGVALRGDDRERCGSASSAPATSLVPTPRRTPPRHGVRVVGVADPVAAKASALAERSAHAVSPTLDDLLGLGVDAISICTPSPTHGDLAVAALAAGVHVLCEKPIARTLADAERIVDGGRVGRRALMIGHVSRFEPDHAVPGSSSPPGALGELRMCRSRSPSPPRPGARATGWPTPTSRAARWSTWRSTASTTWPGSAGSEPIRVHGARGRHRARPGDATRSPRSATPSGAIGLGRDRAGPIPSRTASSSCTEIIGTDGRLSWDYDDVCSAAMVTRRRHRHALRPARRPRLPRRDRRLRRRRSATGSPHRSPPATGARALRTALAAVESVRTGEPVDLEPSSA